jgi:toxin ParE1/3/4
VRTIRWTPEASAQFEAAIDFVQQENAAAAENVAQSVIARVERLASFPGLGRRGEVQGTRELVLSPYVIVYRSTEDVVEILYFWHGAQDWR